MNDNQRQFVGESFIEMQQSLLDSVKKAGGNESSFYYDEIKNITVAELVNRLATNGIRFTHVAPKDEKEDDVIMNVGELIDYLRKMDYHTEVKIESHCDYCGKRKVRNLEEHLLIGTDDFLDTLIIEVV